jgi:hypothetical protein
VIALLFSALITIYLLVPHALFRYILGRSAPVRGFQGSKTEEITRAVVTVAFIFAFALALVWYVPFIKDHPFSFADNSLLRKWDYKVVANGLYSEAMFKEYGDSFWGSFLRSSHRQGRLVFWYYVLCTLVGVTLGWAARRYGSLKRIPGYSRFADFYLLPHISQWHVILTPFTFPDPKTIVRADVLMTDGTLYRGEVAEHFLDANGNLSGLFLRNPQRFDRSRLQRERDSWGTTRPAKVFWREIPSAKLYLVGDKIVNLNLNYEPPTVSPAVVVRYLNLSGKPPITVTFSRSVSAQDRELSERRRKRESEQNH